MNAAYAWFGSLNFGEQLIVLALIGAALLIVVSALLSTDTRR